jgi:hypothetical protein
MKFALISFIAAALVTHTQAAPSGVPRQDKPSKHAAEIIGPKAFIMGTGTGACASSSFAFIGFGEEPVVDVHTSAAGVVIRDLVVIPKESGSGFFRFTVEYTAAAPQNFSVVVYITGGTGSTESGFKQHVVNVRRAQ